MDWQHLIMNGEHLAEYAALLAAEGLLGHQHANSGWGTFDDDNMVGATAFMETLELAVELRRAGYGENGERLGFDLYPYTEDAVARCGGASSSGASSTTVAARIDDAALREAQSQKDAVRAYELVYAALGARDRALVGLDVGTTGVKALALTPTARCSPAPERGYPLSTPRPGWAEQDPRGWWGGGEAALEELGDGPRSGSRADARARRARRRGRPVLRPAILWNDQRTGAECAEIEERVGRERLIELTGNRALTGFTAPKLLWLRRHEPERSGAIASCCCRRTTCACA